MTERDNPAASTRRRAAVILNGAAGALVDRPDQAQALQEQMSQCGLDAVLVPRDAGTLPERVRLALQDRPALVIAAGGDGTIACVAQELAGTGVPMAILPFGTMNLLARDLQLPIGDTDAAIRIAAEGTARAIDVGEVNGHVFLCASMLGLPARLARYRESERGGSAFRLWARMARAALRLLASGRRLRVALRLDRETVRLRASSLTVTVNPVDPASGRSFGRLCLDGGDLALYATGRLRLLNVLRLAWRLLLGRWQHDPAIQVWRVRQLAVASRRPVLRVMNDGEVRLLRPPLRYRVRQRALLVVAPTSP